VTGALPDAALWCIAVAAKRRKSVRAPRLQDVHALLCRLIEEFAPDAMAVESVFTA